MPDFIFVATILKIILFGLIVKTTIEIFEILIDIIQNGFQKKILLHVLILILVAGGLTFANKITYSDLRAKAQKGYSIYLDGQEVDVDTISFSQYDYFVNYEDKVITLTHKRQSSFRYLTIPIIH